VQPVIERFNNGNIVLVCLEKYDVLFSRPFSAFWEATTLEKTHRN
jgi:hypothetical protein